MIVAIVGSREFNDFPQFCKYMDEFRKVLEIDQIVSGGAKGADEMAYRYSIARGITFVCHPPIPEDGFPRMYFMRNIRIANHCEFMIAFPKGASTGTRHAIKSTQNLGKKVLVVEIKDT